MLTMASLLLLSCECVHNVSMAAQTRVPNKTELRRYLSRGMTQQQIVEAWEQDSGERVSRSAIAMAIERLGLKSAHSRPSYPEMLPWRVAERHLRHIDARMLRLEGRRRAGGRLSTGEQRWLDQWKDDLLRKNAVIHYEYNSDEGFYWVDRNDPAVVAGSDDLIDRANAVKPEGKVQSPRGGGSRLRPARAAQRRD